MTKASELAKRLREGTIGTDETKTDSVIESYMFQAAALILEQEAENAKLREALASAESTLARLASCAAKDCVVAVLESPGTE